MARETFASIESTAAQAEGLVAQPYHSDISGKEPRYSQLEALNRTLEQRVEARTEQVRTLASALTLAEQKMLAIYLLDVLPEAE